MPHIEVAAGILGGDVMSVLRQAGAITEVPVRAHIIKRVRVGVARYHAQAVIVARIQRDLQSVVVGPVDISHLEDVGQIGELRVERLIERLVSSVDRTIVVTRASAGEASG